MLFKLVHDIRFLGQSKDRIFVFKMSVNIASSVVDLVRRMQCGGDMENLWIMYEHVKLLRLDYHGMSCL